MTKRKRIHFIIFAQSTAIIMIRNCVAVLAVLALTSSAMAQDVPEKSPSFISFNIGGSFATGSFASPVASGQPSGYATSGIHYQFEYAGFITKNAGFGFEVGRFANAVNLTPFGDDFTAYNNSTKVVSPSVVKVVDAKPWKNVYLVAGPYLTFPLKGAAIDFKALGGMMNVTSPEFTYTGAPSVITSVTASSVSNLSFGYVLGTNLRLNLSEKTQLKFGLEFFQTYTPNSFSANGAETTRNTVNLSVLNVSWGLAFRVGK